MIEVGGVYVHRIENCSINISGFSFIYSFFKYQWRKNELEKVSISNSRIEFYRDFV
ncbi:hypothetical protein D8872_07465 [Streptococcus cristatus]|uniref:Uncharacterized protein n=1 Tax=Streptococcus cristatus TaxID=45634 RepID=A0A3R9HDV6_STRCR|nr:hypothetical protein D8872_07465 [Streptococcus cristatus]